MSGCTHYWTWKPTLSKAVSRVFCRMTRRPWALMQASSAAQTRHSVSWRAESTDSASSLPCCGQFLSLKCLAPLPRHLLCPPQPQETHSRLCVPQVASPSLLTEVETLPHASMALLLSLLLKSSGQLVCDLSWAENSRAEHVMPLHTQHLAESRAHGEHSISNGDMMYQKGVLGISWLNSSLTIMAVRKK